MHQFCSVAWLALTYPGFRKIPTECNVFYRSVFNAIFFYGNGMDTGQDQTPGVWRFAYSAMAG